MIDYRKRIFLDDNKDKSAKIISKKTDGEEKSYMTTYSLRFDSDNERRVESVILLDFDMTVSSELITGTPSNPGESVSDLEFDFRPMLENLVNEDIDFSFIDKHLKSSKMKYTFHKIYNRTTDRKIAKAKKKQINSRSSREKKNYSDDEE